MFCSVKVELMGTRKLDMSRYDVSLDGTVFRQGGDRVCQSLTLDIGDANGQVFRPQTGSQLYCAGFKAVISISAGIGSSKAAPPE